MSVDDMYLMMFQFLVKCMFGELSVLLSVHQPNVCPNEYRIARRVLMVDVSAGRARGRPRLTWMDDVKVAMGTEG